MHRVPCRWHMHGTYVPCLLRGSADVVIKSWLICGLQSAFMTFRHARWHLTTLTCWACCTAGVSDNAFGLDPSRVCRPWCVFLASPI
jgi:hypothetical protein